MGQSELAPSATGIGAMLAPTLFDRAAENMRRAIKEELTWEIFNPLAWKVLGISGGPIRRWLKRYIDVATNSRTAYAPSESEEWFSQFKTAYGYDDDELQLLFTTFFTLVSNNQIDDEIYRPWTAEEPSREGPLAKTMKTVLTYAVVGAVVYGVILSSPKILKGFRKK